MKEREFYLEKLVQARDTDFVKVITGVRRSGKSFLLLLFKRYLLNQGVDEKRIIEINYEKFEFDVLKSNEALHAYLGQRIQTGERYYLLIDEVQEVNEWAKAVNSIRAGFAIDIYVTGSNSRMFSGEHLSYLSGRYIEIKVFPLSFREFIDFRNSSDRDLEKEFSEYLRIGSFPAVSLTMQEELIEAIISGLFDSIFSRDIVLRGRIRDEGVFYKVAKFVMENIGNPLSAHKIMNTLKSQGHKITTDTVDNYLKLMCDAYILYSCERYDIRGKERLKTNGKYYVVDTGLRNKLIGYRQGNLDHVVENIVFLHLLRQGYEVCVGKNGAVEVDFIAVKGDRKEYYQVSLSVLDETTLEREIKPFNTIQDHYPKYLITMDRMDMSIEGIIHWNLFDFLMQPIL